MARAPLTLIRQTRSPERQQLADAILERDRRAALIEAKRAEISATEEARDSLYDRQREAKEVASRFVGMRREMDRRDALLRGETPPAEDEAEKARAAVEEVKAALAQSHEIERVLRTDLDMLRAAYEQSAYDVKTGADRVIASEKTGAPDAVIAAYYRAREQVRMLERAIQGALNVQPAGGQALMYSVDTWTRPSLPPCPWQAACDRLVSDPDARLPMPDDVFAEPPPRPAA
jgi:hypothetical protein